ncbi:hypothetical protein N7462_009382 [Penicillium macrosclerotiorum]|uniref:uncharacterized protein n=1 Tax=Penicillium macrosclerotiorum TaxID=303699 RepID=UPI0025499ECB|nr:uncharacterized protein N7462_009382 [Penicillium macrosclerotiorum]KAJ5673943.1 hypothetical protein N7462_009382 [Penicillium macrosclerotiorum]
MRLRTPDDDQIADLISSLRIQCVDRHPRTIYHIPLIEAPRLYGREETLAEITSRLSPDAHNNSLQFFALYGMSGVGKTQVALRYANASRDKFDLIFWISACSRRVLQESFQTVATLLGLNRPGTTKDDEELVSNVHTWLSSTESRWLLVYDDANDVHLLSDFWPSAMRGSILVTGRNPAIAFSLTSRGHRLHPFDVDTASRMLLKILDLDSESKLHQKDAENVCTRLGGLPLALDQIGGFIFRRNIALKDFLAVYDEYTEEIDDDKTMSTDGRCLASLWGRDIAGLWGGAQTLLTILAFLSPNGISEKFLQDAALRVRCSDMDFMYEKVRLSMHRLIQRAAIRRMDHDKQANNFSLVVAIVSASLTGSPIAPRHTQADSWEACERILPHVDNLLELNQEFDIVQRFHTPLAQLLLRCSGQERYSAALRYIKTALEMLPAETLARTSALDLWGITNLAICRPKAALQAFKEAYNLRTATLPQDHISLAGNSVNLGIAWTELREFDEAEICLRQSIEIREKHLGEKIGNSCGNMASLLLRAGRIDEAEKMLRRCCYSTNFTDEALLETTNPRLSGDLMLLSRVQSVQGNRDKALRFADRALNLRKGSVDGRLKVCDSLYQLAVLGASSDAGLASQLLTECIQFAAKLPKLEGIGHLARANYRLSRIFGEQGREDDRATCLEQATQFQEEFLLINGEEALVSDKLNVVFFDQCVPWMLW